MTVARRIETLHRRIETLKRRDALAGGDGSQWAKEMFPRWASADFAPHHLEMLRWAGAVESGVAPRPFVAVWPRGGAKSTLAEIAVAMLGLQGGRRYALFVSETQNQADRHVSNIGSLLESDAVERAYPEHGDREVSKHGYARGWRRNRLQTAGGFTVEGFGLDTAARGAKIDAYRPDVIVLDDVDGEHDTERISRKKLNIITRSILPAGSADAAIIVTQNLIHADGVVARLVDGRADMLGSRTLSGPVPSVHDLETERVRDEVTKRWRDVIRGGRPSWPGGQPLEACQELIDRIGLSAFLVECQHEVHEKPGALWNRRCLVNNRVAEPPRDDDGNLLLTRIVIGVDPSGGKGEIGIVAAGLRGSTAYVLKDATVAGALGPRAWATAVVNLYHELQADAVVVERNYGGDMARYTLETVDPSVNIKEVTASRGKALRAEPIASLYGAAEVEYVDSCVRHVGTFPQLETELCGWAPGDDSPNRLDALVWALTELMIARSAPMDFTRVF